MGSAQQPSPVESKSLKLKLLYSIQNYLNQLKMASSSSSSSGGAYIPEGVNLTKAKVKRKKNSDWSWEDEMLMYDVTNKDTLKKRRLVEKEQMTEEMKRIKREKEMEALYQREERKLFLGGLSLDTVEKDLRK